MLVPTSTLVAQAATAHRGIPAFNVITLEHAEAIAQGAEAAGVAVIMQISENAVRFHGGRLAPIAAATSAVAHSSRAAIALHLDHVTSEELLSLAPASGFGSVMYDGSALPYDENVATTRSAVLFGHTHGLWVESELGAIGGKGGSAGGAHDPGVRTHPGEAREFVQATGIDGLAVAVGSRHAMTTRDATLDHDLIREIASAVDVPLVLHGSSGVSDADLREAIAGGMVKVNIGTALNRAFTTSVRASLAQDERATDPRPYLASARDAMAEVVATLARVISA